MAPFLMRKRARGWTILLSKKRKDNSLLIFRMIDSLLPLSNEGNGASLRVVSNILLLSESRCVLDNLDLGLLLDEPRSVSMSENRLDFRVMLIFVLQLVAVGDLLPLSSNQRLD